MHEIADSIAALPALTGRSTRMALTQRLRRVVEEGSAYGLALKVSVLPMLRGEWLLKPEPGGVVVQTKRYARCRFYNPANFGTLY